MSLCLCYWCARRETPSSCPRHRGRGYCLACDMDARDIYACHRDSCPDYAERGEKQNAPAVNREDALPAGDKPAENDISISCKPIIAQAGEEGKRNE